MAQKIIGFRATDSDRLKLESISKITGLGMSGVLRRLIEAVEVQPAQFKVDLSGGEVKNNSIEAGSEVANG